MTEIGDQESSPTLANEWLRRSGLQVKLDKGFAKGSYCLYVEFDALAERTGFAAARKKAAEYCALLHEQLSKAPGYKVRTIEDASRTADPSRKRDLEMTFLSFAIKTADGRYHDDAMQKDFRLAFLRAGQAWDQAQAHAQAKRRDRRQEQLRHELAALLAGDHYTHLDAATKERLLHDIPALAFPAKGVSM